MSPRNSQIIYIVILYETSNFRNRVGVAMVSVGTSSAVDRGFEPQSGETKDYKSGICYFTARHAALRRKSKDWLTLKEYNVSEWGDISIRELFFQ